jgi:hypothetical protein
MELLMESMSPKLSNDQDRKVWSKIIKEHNIWYLMANWMRALHIILGILTVVCSLLVASHIDSFSQTLIEWLAFIAALSVGLQSAFDLGARINRLRRAWWSVNVALMKFDSDPEFLIRDLIKAYEKGQELSGEPKEEFR